MDGMERKVNNVSRDKLCPLSLLLSTRALALLLETLIKENHHLEALSSLTPTSLPVY